MRFALIRKRDSIIDHLEKDPSILAIQSAQAYEGYMGWLGVRMSVLDGPPMPEQLATASQELDARIYSIHTQEEVSSLAVLDAATTFTRGVLHENTALATDNERLLLDELTGVGNLAQFVRDYPEGSVLPAGKTLLTIDVSGLKTYNSQMGHDGGDILLKSAASVLQSVAGSKVYRKGGDEFMLVCDQDISLDEWNELNSHLQDELRRTIPGDTDQDVAEGAVRQAFMRAGKTRSNDQDIPISRAITDADVSESTIREIYKTLSRIEGEELKGAVFRNMAHAAGKDIVLDDTLPQGDERNASLRGIFRASSQEMNPFNVPLMATMQDILGWINLYDFQLEKTEAGVKLFVESEGVLVEAGHMRSEDR